MTAPNPFRAAALSLLVSLACVSCRSTADDVVEQDYPVLRSTEMGSMHNVSVAGTVWFGGTPSAEDLDLAKRRGIESVIALTGSDRTAYADLARKCGELGLEFVTVPVTSNETVPEGTVDMVLESLRASSESPTLMFCESGDKSAMFFAIHRAVNENVAVEDALIEARRAGMKPGPPEIFVLRHIERLTGWELLAAEE